MNGKRSYRIANGKTLDHLRKARAERKRRAEKAGGIRGVVSGGLPGLGKRR